MTVVDGGNDDGWLVLGVNDKWVGLSLFWWIFFFMSAGQLPHGKEVCLRDCFHSWYNENLYKQMTQQMKCRGN